MKIILLLAAFVLLNYATAADKFESIPDEEKSTNHHEISDFDNEVSDIQDLGEELEEKDNNDKDDKVDENDAKDGDNTEISKESDKATGEEEQVIKTQGLTISVGNGGKIGISLTGNNIGQKTVYTRYGRNSCRRGARLIYNGYVGGSSHGHRGDGVKYLCMPKFPQYISTTRPAHPGLLYGSEYESHNRIFSGTHDWNVPCAVCQVPKSTKMTIPAKVRCPSGWTREYYGYLMTEHYNHPRSATYECMDAFPEKIPGSQRNTNGALFYFVQAQCGVGLPCGPYVTNRALTCVVCSA